MATKKAAAEAKKAVKAEKKVTKKTVKKAEMKISTVLQFQGHEFTEADFVEQAKKLWADAGKTEAIEEMQLYVKPEDGAVYCVINGEEMNGFEL